MKRKLLIITAILRREALERSDEELQQDIRTKLSPETIPWVDRIEKITVLSED